MNFKDLSKRLLSAFFSICILFGVLYFARTPFFQIVITLLILGLCGLALFEFASLIQKKGIKVKKPFFIVSGLIFTFSFYFLSFSSLVPLLVFFVFFITLFVLHFSKIKNAIFSLSTNVLGLLYIALPLGLVFPLLYFSLEDGRVWLFYLLAVTKSCDIGGYFGGRFFGKKKLVAHLSPKKTIAGAVSGTVLALFVSYVFYALSQREFFSSFSLNLPEALLLGLILAIGAQIGDLAESLLKRDAGVKDSGRLPGFGGVLDMLDSLLFNLPILFFYLEVLK